MKKFAQEINNFVIIEMCKRKSESGEREKSFMRKREKDRQRES